MLVQVRLGAAPGAVEQPEPKLKLGVGDALLKGQAEWLRKNEGKL
jgi:hypothetical protein